MPTFNDNVHNYRLAEEYLEATEQEETREANYALLAGPVALYRAHRDSNDLSICRDIIVGDTETKKGPLRVEEERVFLEKIKARAVHLQPLRQLMAQAGT